ncbi:hypothetical protein [Pseudoalteromonas rubra]|uniref:hypothetical protein n=1 Tax=Pseudoalteromonas rubra TaxID=43658 RepID=UPI002DB6778A|nr:hypothetical protein [Pseudoalteromonas rubra]MEC4091583.1 hypothetical protein [Pseudoalteromonas rubra]
MRIHIPGFGGEVPAIPPERLSDHQATLATNCLLDDADLTPLHAPQTLTDQPQIPQPKHNTLYLYSPGKWFVFEDDVDVVPSPILQDAFGRVYFTGAGKPKVTNNTLATGSGVLPASAYELGVPAPSKKPGTTLQPGSGEDEEGLDDDETRYYVYTYVTDTGEESAPSPLSNRLVMTKPSDRVALTLSAPDNNISGITHFNVYRSAESAEDALFQLVAKLPLHTTSYTDTKRQDQLTHVLSTIDYLPPPEDLNGLIGLDGGMLAGFTGSTVCISEAYLPYAWPDKYQLKTKWPIVGMKALPGGAVVCTEGEPYLLMGTAPDAMMLETTGTQQACVSKRSMVAMDGYVLYASPDGIVRVAGGVAELISEPLFKPRQWQALKPETIHAYYHEGEYIAFYGDTTNGLGYGTGGFILNPGRRDVRYFDFYSPAGYRDLKSDSFYILMTGKLKKWSGDAVLPATWRSKKFKTTVTNFAVCQVQADDISGIEITLYADGNLFHRQTLTTEFDGTFWLPPGLHSTWQVEIKTTKPVRAITLAESPEDLD